MIKQEYQKLLLKEVRRIISTACGIQSENFKKNVSLIDLINYKNIDEKKFQLYVTAPHYIKENIQALFPFIDVSIIDLNWTTNEILYSVINTYNKIDIVKLEKIKM